jgi:hypothetical protein
MSFSVMSRCGAFAIALACLLGLSGVASAAKGAPAKGVVIATPGLHGVEIVGKNHQARMLLTRHRARSIRPGAVVRYTLRKGVSVPVRLTRIGHVKQIYVIGVAVRGSVRLADGTRLQSRTVRAGVAALRFVAVAKKPKPPTQVHVKLHFDSGHTKVVTVTPAPSTNGKKKKKTPPPPPPAPVPPAPVTPPSPVVTDPVPTPGPWWKPTASAPLPLHWMINGALTPSAPIQLGLRALNGATLPAPAVFDIDGETNSKATVDALHATGAKVICYVDAGTYENWRSDASKLKAVSGLLGKAVSGWQGENWLDVRRISDLAPVMQARFQDCKAKGFDAIEPDNIDGYTNGTGFPLTAADQLAYNKALAGWAHTIGLSIGLKNDLDQASALVGDFDWALDEECYTYSECSSLTAFTHANKAVWIAEYKSVSSSSCADSATNHFNTAQYALDLGPTTGRQPCAATW